MITAYPKIFAIGTSHIGNIFNEPVEVTEKVDGSQFCFGRVDGQVFVRSKGAQLYFDNPDKMFTEAVTYIEQIQDRLPEGMIFYSEYLKKPKHNTIKYDRVPKNHLILFGVMGVDQKFNQFLPEFADMLEIESVPVLYNGMVGNINELVALLETDSILGGSKIEGVVAKNYARSFLLNDRLIPIMAGKFVSEKFKETHRDRWGAEEIFKSRMDVFKESFRTPGRWEKAVQHVAECGGLENSPKDIGKLIKAIQVDIEAEDIDDIKAFLWSEFKGDIMRKAVAGFPEWYKIRLAERSFTQEA